MKKNTLLKMLAIFALFGAALYAGTGGSEVASWYTDIADALKGTWGKIIAVAFLGFTIILFKGGQVLGGIFMMLVGLSIGTIPDIVDSKYSALMSDPSASMDAISYIKASASELLGL